MLVKKIPPVLSECDLYLIVESMCLCFHHVKQMNDWVCGYFSSSFSFFFPIFFNFFFFFTVCEANFML